MVPQRPHTTSLLYFSLGNTPSGEPHKHPFYQLEYCLSGKLFCQTENSMLLLNEGDYCLVPPEHLHQFMDRPDPFEYLTIKFKSERKLEVTQGNAPIVCYLLNDILNLIISKSKSIPPFSQEGKFIIENNLNGILDWLASTQIPQRRESYIASEIRKAVYFSGYRVNVSSLATYFNCSRTQFYYMFKKECSDRSAKTFIDDLLIDMAKRHLNYSAMNVSAIASEMNFPSVYAFSRFFKSKTGLSPLEYRNRLNRASDNPPSLDI